MISPLRGGDGSATALSDGAQDLWVEESEGLWQPAQKTWEDGPAMALLTGPQDLLIHVRMLKTYGNTYKSDIADRHQKSY